MAKNIKQVHPDYLICYKVGNFYNCYGKDAYIISSLFNYNIKYVESNISITGFSKNAISKVMAKLEREKINYIVIDTRNNYDVDYKFNLGNLNQYNELYEKAKKTVNMKLRVEQIKDKLLKVKDAEIIKKVEAIIDES